MWAQKANLVKGPKGQRTHRRVGRGLFGGLGQKDSFGIEMAGRRRIAVLDIDVDVVVGGIGARPADLFLVQWQDVHPTTASPFERAIGISDRNVEDRLGGALVLEIHADTMFGISSGQASLMCRLHR